MSLNYGTRRLMTDGQIDELSNLLGMMAALQPFVDVSAQATEEAKCFTRAFVACRARAARLAQVLAENLEGEDDG